MNAVFKRVFLIVAFLGQAGAAMAADASPIAVTARIMVSVRLKVDPKPTVKMTAVDSNAAEYPPNWGQIWITRTGDLGSTLTVHFTTGGTATSGVDYESIPEPVTFPAGMASVALSIKPKNDSLKEDTETVTLTLALDNAYVIGSPAAATVSIANRNAVESRFWSLYE